MCVTLQQKLRNLTVTLQALCDTVLTHRASRLRSSTARMHVLNNCSV
jgi:hypothetical protein